MEEFEFEFDAILAETDLAYLFDLGVEEVWVPKSQLMNIDKEEGCAIIPEWLAEKLGWI